MIQYASIRNRSQLDKLWEHINTMRLPFKFATEPIEPVRSIGTNNYLFGIVYSYIAEETGQSVEEVHKGYKRLFRFRHDFKYNAKLDQYEFVLASQSTADAGQYELWNYIMQVRADGEIEHHIRIPMPNEVFGNKLTFEEES